MIPVPDRLAQLLEYIDYASLAMVYHDWENT